ncbi:MAG: hypothetical protein GC154_03630 [bacterium]|nr:hypothetical protein [bacterium]
MKVISLPRILIACWLVLLSLPAVSAPWWASETIEDQRTPAAGLTFQRVLYTAVDGQPVRAHILSVTGVGPEYLFGVLGSYGVVVQPSILARNSQAVAAINGGFFSVNPTRAQGMVMVHGRLLYPPPSAEAYQASLGFTPDSVLIGRIGPQDVSGDRIQTNQSGWNACYAALSAGPVLVKDSTSQVMSDDSVFNTQKRAPRTAMGVRKDGLVWMMVVDGRQPDWSAGVTLAELAEIFLALGARNAINLDGGGSSVMILQNEVVNRPSDLALPGQPGRERAVANIVALLRKSQ